MQEEQNRYLGRDDLGKSLSWSNGLFYFLAGILVLLTLFLPFFSLFALSFIFVMAFKKISARLGTQSRNKKWIYRGLAAATLFLFVSLCFYSMNLIYTGMSSLNATDVRTRILQHINSIMNPLREYASSVISTFFPQSHASLILDGKLNEYISQGTERLASMLLNIIVEVPDNILLGVFLCFSCYWIAKQYSEIRSKSLAYLPGEHLRERVGAIWTILEDSAYSSVVTTLLVSLAQGSLVGLTALVIGNKTWPLYFFGAFVCSFFPVVGLLFILLCGTLHIYFVEGLGAAAVFALIVLSASMAENFFRVHLMAQATEKINAFFSFFSLIGAIYIFGIKGLILGPFLIAVTSGFFKAAERSLKNLNESKKSERPEQENSPKAEIVLKLGVTRSELLLDQ